MAANAPPPICRLHTPTADGNSPVKRRTVLGGACTLLAAGAIAAIVALLVSTYLQQASVVSQPVFVPATLSYASLPTAQAHALNDLPTALWYARPHKSGLGIAVLAHGPRCGRLAAWNASNLLQELTSVHGPGFAYSSTFDYLTGAAVHMFDCPSCGLLATSFLDVHLDVTCQVRLASTAAYLHLVVRGANLPPGAVFLQSLLVLAWAVGANGDVTAASFVHSSSNGSAEPSTVVAISLSVTLQVGILKQIFR